MDFVGNGQRLSEADYAVAARSVGLRVATIKGVIDVEAAGHGFDSKNRPKILCEPHIFYKELGPGPKREAAMKAGVAYPHWGQRPYPKTSDGNYERLAKMVEIDETAALRSASWGLTQVLGENFADCGFKTVQEMVEAFKQGEDDMLLAFMRLVEKWGLIDELKRRDAAGFARRYNGSAYARNGYDKKLLAAWKRRDKEPVMAPTSTDDAPISAHDVAPADTRALPPAVVTPPVTMTTTHTGAGASAVIAVIGAASHNWWIMAVAAVAVGGFVLATHFIRKAST